MIVLRLFFLVIKRYIKIIFSPLIFILLLNNKEKLGRFLYSLKKDNNINIIKTLWVNYLSFPFNIAKHLPIYVYGTLDFTNKGKILIEDVVYSGMIRINCMNRRTMSKTKFENNGVVILQKHIRIFGGAHFFIGEAACLKIEKNVTICEDTLIWCEVNVEIGEHSDLAYCSQIFDSNSHFTIDIETGDVSKYARPVKIGKRNWIANHSTIKSGTKTPDNIMVASSYSVLNKDYTQFVSPYTIVGGCPVRVLKKGVGRIYDVDVEKKLYMHEFNKCPKTIKLNNLDFIKLTVSDINYED